MIKILIRGDDPHKIEDLLDKLPYTGLSNEPQESLDKIGLYFASLHSEILGEEINSALWIFSNNPRFKFMEQGYYQGAAGACIFYHVNDKTSLENAIIIIERIQSIQPSLLIAMFGINLTASSEAQAYYENAEKIAQQYGCLFFIVDKKNFVETFYNFILIVRQKDLGIKLHARKQYSLAIAAYEDSLRLNVHSAETWYHLGMAKQDQGDLPGAIQAYANSLQIDPRNSDVWYNLGCAYKTVKDNKAAINALQQAQSLQPNVAKIWLQLGEVHFIEKNLALAEEAFGKAVELEPRNYNYLTYFGLSLYKKGDLQKGKDYLLLSLEILQEQDPPYYQCAPLFLAICEVLEELPESDIRQYQELYEKILSKSGSEIDLASSQEQSSRMPSPFELVVKWHSLLLSIIIRNASQKKLGEFPAQEVNSLLSTMDSQMDMYENTDPERAETYRPFWNCVKGLLLLFEKNINRRWDEFPKCYQELDLALAHANLNPNSRDIFTQLKNHLNEVNVFLSKVPSTMFFGESLSKFSRKIKELMEKCLSVEFPHTTFGAILSANLTKEAELLRSREIELKLEALEAERKKLEEEQNRLSGSGPSRQPGKPEKFLTPEQEHLIDLFHLTENSLREIINKIVVSQEGENWIDKALRPEDAKIIKERWQEGYASNQKHRIIDELTFDQYSQIIKGRRFSESFKAVFLKDYDLIFNTINHIREIRNNINHVKWHIVDVPDATRKVVFLKDLLQKFKIITDQ